MNSVPVGGGTHALRPMGFNARGAASAERHSSSPQAIPGIRLRLRPYKRTLSRWMSRIDAAVSVLLRGQCRSTVRQKTGAPLARSAGRHARKAGIPCFGRVARLAARGPKSFHQGNRRRVRILPTADYAARGSRHGALTISAESRAHRRDQGRRPRRRQGCVVAMEPRRKRRRRSQLMSKAGARRCRPSRAVIEEYLGRRKASFSPSANGAHRACRLASEQTTSAPSTAMPARIPGAGRPNSPAPGMSPALMRR